MNHLLQEQRQGQACAQAVKACADRPPRTANKLLLPCTRHLPVACTTNRPYQADAYGEIPMPLLHIDAMLAALRDALSDG